MVVDKYTADTLACPLWTQSDRKYPLQMKLKDTV